jgi:hypothetical protein
MVELSGDTLIFSFPEVHPAAQCRIEFQRTLRIPDDNRAYALPPGLGRFPILHVDDYTDRLPPAWYEHGGVFIPMYQSEALWIAFHGDYPCAVKVAAGKINAVSGEPWSNELAANPQDYVVVPDQPWLDGFNVAKGLIRQFVAMPLGEGYTAEEQITGKAEWGGLQIIVYPMRREEYQRRFELSRVHEETYLQAPMFSRAMRVCEMGLAPGGLMRQEIYRDRYGIDAWDQDHGYRCFIHLANSVVYREITGQAPPHRPFTAKEYTDAGLPWFEYYGDGEALEGAPTLGGLLSLGAKIVGLGKELLKDNEPVQPKMVRSLGVGKVRDGSF